jgi:hypothetical protein
MHNKELLNLYSSLYSYVIRMIRSRIMRWVGHVVCLGKMINVYSILIGKADGRRPV